MDNNSIYEYKGKACFYKDGEAFEYFYNTVTGRFEKGKAVKLPKGFNGFPITIEQVKAKYSIAIEDNKGDK